MDDIWAADLMDVSNLRNRGVNYVLMVIDALSKYGWMVPMKTKSGVETASSFAKILKGGRKPGKVWVDKGTEFYNEKVKKLFPLYSTENEEKSSVVERWIRTIKDKLSAYFTANDTLKFTDILQPLAERYNNTKHSTIKMTPVEASDPDRSNEVYRNTYGIAARPVKKPEFEVGDRVRLTRKKGAFEKGYTPGWTRELFRVVKVLDTYPITYSVEGIKPDKDGDTEVKGSFYAKELQKTIINE